MDGLSSKRCFVISPIGGKESDVRRHANDVLEYIIEPALHECGIEPVRSDQILEPGRITEQMFRHIVSDTFCVALLTGHNPNVYYELAVAQVARRPVIILLEKDQELPFDIKDLRCVYYDFSPTAIKKGTYVEELVERIKALEATNWDTSPLSPELDAIGVKQALRCFSSPRKLGTAADWLQIIEDAETEIWLMGTSLVTWYRNEEFEKVIRQKAEAGCRVRIVTASEDNRFVEDDLKVKGRTTKSWNAGIRETTQFFSKLAKEVDGIEFHQISKQAPSCFMMRTDRTALMVVHFHESAWDQGPLLRCSPQSKLFDRLVDEFEWHWDHSD